MIPGIRLQETTAAYENPLGLRLVEKTTLHKGDLLFPMSRHTMSIPGQRSVEAIRVFVVFLSEDHPAEGLPCYVLASALKMPDRSSYLRLVHRR
jgi:hypothetical protein